MSSTKRSDSRKTHIADYYVTPIESIVDFLMEFFDDNPQLNFGGKKILDPCAGGDSIHDMSYPKAIEKWEYLIPPKVTTLDIRNDSKAKIKTNYMEYHPETLYDVIITNPPFNIALPVIQKALEEVVDGGLVIMLLRLNFFGSIKRSEWFYNHMPKWCYVHSRRMKFINTKGTDSIEYMHAVWMKEKYPKFTQLRII